MTPYWDQICDDILCFDATNTTVYYRPQHLQLPRMILLFFCQKFILKEQLVVPYTRTKSMEILETSRFNTGEIQIWWSGLFSDIPETPVSFSVLSKPCSSQLSVNVSTNGNSVQFNVIILW